MIKEIKIIDNFIDNKTIDALLNYYEVNKNQALQFRDTFPLNIKNLPIKKIYNNIYKGVVVDWLEIVKWPSNSYQNLHLDKASNKTVLTSITYLNENYSGGETYFKDGTIIKPKTGRTLIFDGMHYVHGVKTIKKGTRYTLPVWYKRCEK